MRFPIIAKTVASLAVLVAGTSVMAAPAHASTAVTVTSGSVSPSSVTDTEVVISNNTPTGTINLAGNTDVYVSVPNDCSGGCSITNGASVTFRIAPWASSGFFDILDGGFQPIGRLTVTFGIAPTPGPTPSSDSVSSGLPAPVTQSFGQPGTGTCEEAQPEGLNWAGVPSGGWGNSWAQWMSNNTGGPVCTRTLVYSNALAKWTVN